ncbi:MAG: DUF4838 domain-containing protein, partial [Deltaproteobacteria bacterium]|nr:DUF4838 domain-containing protein [Deltaproteobacteria bacterium]
MINHAQSFMLAFSAFIQIIGWNCAFAEKSLEKIHLFKNGRCCAAVLVDPQASAQVRDSAALLARCFQLSTGVHLSVSKRPASSKPIRIHVGLSKYVTHHVKDLKELDGDGFVIAFPNNRNIVIAGPTDWGAEFGVYEFLERYVGVRWLFPGPAGEHVTKNSTLDIPVKEVRQEPAFFSRQLSGLRGKEQKSWARRNRMHGRVRFHHNLLRLFPPEKYTKIYPKFFPIIRGRRYLPPTNRTHGWQPCFSAPGIVEEAIKNICNYFSEHPKETSYSLGVNDSSGYCECKECRERDNGKKNFLG